MQYHQNEIPPANGTIGAIRILRRNESLETFAVDEKGLGRLDLRNWASWREALLRFMARGSFHPNLTKGERRRIQTMAAQFRLEEMETEGKRTLQLLYHNRHEQYVPVPRSHNEILQIMQHYHDQHCAGHYAAEMTFRRVYRTYYWPTIRIDIWNYVRSCDSCQRAQDLTEYPVELLHPIICLEPFEIVHVDYAGPYTTAGTG